MNEIILDFNDLITGLDALDNAQDKLREFERRLEATAANIKRSLQDTAPDNEEQIAAMEKQMADLIKVVNRLREAKVDLSKVEERLNEAQNETTLTTEEQRKNLANLTKEQDRLRAAIRKVTSLQRQGSLTDQKAAEQKSELRLQLAEVNRELRSQQREILDKNKLSREEQRLLQAQLTLQNEQVSSIREIRQRIAALRIVQAELNLETEEGQRLSAEYVREINELTQRLSNNSDEFIKNKINIGNYEDSIVSALERTGLFSSGIQILDDSIGGLIIRLVKGKEATEAQRKQTEASTAANQANRRSFLRLGRAVRGFGRVLRSAGIGAILIALGSLFAIFRQGRAGVIRTNQAMAAFAAISKVVVTSLADVGRGLFDLLAGLATFDREQVRRGVDALAESFDNLGERIDNARDSVQTSFQAIIDEFELRDEIRQANIELVAMRQNLRLLEIEGGDATLSLNRQLRATREALQANIAVLEQEADIQRINLAIANEKARADLQANAATIGSRADAVAAIQDEVRFAEELLRLNQSLAVTDNPLDDNLLEEQQTALVEYLSTLSEVEIAQAETAKELRQINQDIFEQNLDLLIDLIDTQKNASEAFINDITNNFESQVRELSTIISAFRKNAQRELDQFNQLARFNQLDLDFEVRFNDDGSFDVLLNDTALSIDNIVELNKELQATGLSEIAINRFREFLIETRNGVRDFQGLTREVINLGIEVENLREDLTVGEDELETLTNLEERLRDVSRALDGSISQTARERLLREYQEIQDEITKIQEDSEKKRQENRIVAIDEELKTVEVGSKRFFELLNERNRIQTDLLNKSIQEQIKATDESVRKQAEAFKRLQEELRGIFQDILKEAVRINQERLRSTEDRVRQQETAEERQRERAAQGLENSLAFEQEQLRAREADRARQERRLQRVQQLQTLYQAYLAYLQDDSTDAPEALGRALRDFGIIRGVAATFEDGGIVSDKIAQQNKGILRGPRHSAGGILIEAEGQEGILSRKDMNNLGRDNFYTLKNMLSSGPIGKNFFSGQAHDFNQIIPVTQNRDAQIVKKLEELTSTIKNQPRETLDFMGVVDGVGQIVTTKHNSGRNVTTKRFIKPKPRF